MYHSVLVHNAESSRHQAGQEDFLIHVLSSRQADEGVSTVLLERQDDPTAGLVARASPREALRAITRWFLAHTPFALPTQPAGILAAPAAGEHLEGSAIGT